MAPIKTTSEKFLFFAQLIDLLLKEVLEKRPYKIISDDKFVPPEFTVTGNISTLSAHAHNHRRIK